MDIQILLFIQENIRHYILTPFFTLITNEYFLYILLGIVLIYMFKKNEDTRRLAKETIIAFLICTVLFIILKLIFQRPRPFDAFNELIPLVDKPSDYSFPSGHTASAFIFLYKPLHEIHNERYTRIHGIFCPSVSLVRKLTSSISV